MKKSITIKAAVALTIFLVVFFLPVSASKDPAVQERSAASLVRLKLMQGYEDGSLRLQNKIKRSEFITLVVKMLGYDKDNDTGGVNVNFKDINTKHWAYNNIRTALKYGIISGYPDNTVAPDKYVTFAEALTVMVRVLGYESSLPGNWPDNIIQGAGKLGLTQNLDIVPTKQLTRGEVSVLVSNSLTVELKK